MKKLATYLFLSAELLSTGSYSISINQKLDQLLNEGWKIETIDAHQTSPSPLDPILLSFENKKILILGDQIISEAQGNLGIEFSTIHYGKKGNYFIQIKKEQKIHLFHNSEDLGLWDQVQIGKTENENRRPHVLLKKENNFFINDGQNQFGPYKAKEGKILSSAGDKSLALLCNKSLNEEDKEFTLIENGISSPAIKELFEWQINKNGTFYYFYRQLDHLCKFREGRELSETWESPGEIIPAISDKESEIEYSKEKIYPIYNPRTKEWFLYKGRNKIGPWEKKPEAIKRLKDGALVWAGLKDGKWGWYKNNILIVETEPFAFSSEDIHFYKNHYALIKKKGSQFEVYADFKKRVSFSQKPSLQFINNNLIKIEGKIEVENANTENRPKKFQALFELDRNQIHMQNEPLIYKIFKDDYFDFWLKTESGWTAYQDGKAKGKIQTDDESKLIAFTLLGRLFFPDWGDENGNNLMLKGTSEIIGPFTKIVPLERFNKDALDSRLYTSLIFENEEGVHAIYNDTIIGPADDISPHFNDLDPNKILGLFIELQKNPQYYSKETQMIPQETSNIISINLMRNGEIKEDKHNKEKTESTLIRQATKRSITEQIEEGPPIINNLEKSIDKKDYIETDKEFEKDYQDKISISEQNEKEENQTQKSSIDLDKKTRIDNIQILHNGKMVALTSDWKAIKSNERWSITCMTEKGRHLLLPSGLRIPCDKLIQIKLSAKRELALYQLGEKVNLLLKEENGRALQIKDVTKIVYQSPLKNKQFWIVVERKIEDQLWYQIYVDRKAVFIVKKNEALGYEVLEYPEAGVFGIFPPKEKTPIFLTEKGPDESWKITKRKRLIRIEEGKNERRLRIYPLKKSQPLAKEVKEK